MCSPSDTPLVFRELRYLSYTWRENAVLVVKSQVDGGVT
jgi:hypothetical protein